MPPTEAEGRGVVGRGLSGLMPSSARLVAWGGAAGLTGFLLWAGQARAHWPWFSLWVLLLIALVGAMALPRTRRALRISWFGVTLLTLTGVCLANAFLFYVESHRQRSERLEVRGVYHAPSNDVLSIGVGRAGLDVVLEGDPMRFERWGLEVEAARGDTFLITQAREVETLRVRRGDAWGFPGNGRIEQVIGDPLNSRTPARIAVGEDGETHELALLRGRRRGVLAWGDARAALTLDDPLLNRMFGRTLRSGVPLAELPWDSIPDPAAARDLVLTQVGSGRTLGRLTLTLPTYRVVSRSSGKLAGDGVPVLPGDTLRVTSRGSTWAFALDRVPSVSRVAAPTAVMFVRRPRPGGWALPSAEACGPAVDRCAIISSEALPPPQPHFDLSGFGLDGDAYSFLGRLETESEGVGIVTASERAEFGYGVVQPVAARKADADAPDAGYLMRVHRSDTASRSAVLLTVLGLYGLFVSALLVLLGNPYLARRLRSESANTSAAWALLNVFIIFLGVRLVLGLRVAYAAPFYDRAAATSVGLWIAFAAMLVFLGRWDRWTPLVWKAAARVRRPVSRLLLRSVEATEPTAAQTASAGTAQVPTSDPATRRGRVLAALGLIGMTTCTTGLIWQRPTAGLGLFVAAIALGAWIALGLFGPAGRPQEDKGRLIRPVDVLTADFLSTHPSRAFTMAAGIAIVLALAIQAPIVALGPVCAGLVLFGVATLLERGNVLGNPTRRAWGLYGLSLAAGLSGVWLFFGLAWVPWAVSLAGAAIVALVLGRTPGDSEQTWIALGYEGLLDIGRSIFSGVAWTFVLGGLAFLTFLNFQQIPPFIRFALVFMLFLLAVRAGLVCRRVLDDDRPGAQISALGLLVIPVGVLLVFTLFDFGLGLVFFLPMMVTVLLAAGIDRLPRTLAIGSAAVLLLVTLSAWSVLNPSVSSLRQSDTVAEFSEEFGGLGNPFVDVLREAGLSTPVTRATVRSVAASDPDLIEEALAYAGPSEALLAAAPSLEQVWGGRAYSASGWTGTGLAGTTALGRGVPTVVSYAENAFAVYVLSEHGVLGGMAVLLLYLALLAIVAVWILRVREHIHRSPAGLAGLALTVGSVLWLVLPAAYVAASNLGLLPLTGQNMPFLGLNSWADVVLVCGIGTGVFVTLAGLGEWTESADPFPRSAAEVS